MRKTSFCLDKINETDRYAFLIYYSHMPRQKNVCNFFHRLNGNDECALFFVVCVACNSVRRNQFPPMVYPFQSIYVTIRSKIPFGSRVVSSASRVDMARCECDGRGHLERTV